MRVKGGQCTGCGAVVAWSRAGGAWQLFDAVTKEEGGRLYVQRVNRRNVPSTVLHVCPAGAGAVAVPVEHVPQWFPVEPRLVVRDHDNDGPREAWAFPVLHYGVKK